MPKKEEPDRSGLEIDHLHGKVCISPPSSPESKDLRLERHPPRPIDSGSGAVGHLIGKPGAGGFLIWSLAWREVYCSMGCCSPGRVNC